ncbi:ATP-binding protein [Actinoallomurus purpureus]|uniref:AAA family ATPase n=1 Tax=Actinoallomurus purpureus TaxID=478114 RepID=UPI002091F0B0|nr:ATP-binding protein [Actinoallomurus purpureus]MCO6006567.1 ATP-binding protein [Actinoallomurus purpureus]
MVARFIGRKTELAILGKRLDRVTASGAGIALAVRGRRQVGKSRLVQEFCDQSRVPYVFSAATKGASPVEAVASFLNDLRESALPAERDLIPELGTGSWPDAFRVLASVVPERPCIVVLDELPWLAEQDRLFDGALQTAWDRLLSSKPVLLLLLGSDLHMMERLTAYDRPFFGRADNLVLGPLNPADVGQALGLRAADAIDAHLVSGGLPGIVRSWPEGMPALEFLRQEAADPAAAVFSVPEAALMAEFPSPDASRRVLEAVGAGDRTHANIAATAGSREGALPSGTLSPLLRRLAVEKQILAVDEPVSTTPGKPALYRVADSNLRLYLGILRVVQEQARRGRPEAGVRLVERRWTGWRGRAAPPLVRQSLELAALSGALPWPDVEAVGGWWNRRFDPEIDLIGADRAPVADTISFAGSIKWLASGFDGHDLVSVRRAVAQVPGYDPARTGLVVASLSGLGEDVDDRSIDLLWGPEDVVGSWRG